MRHRWEWKVRNARVWWKIRQTSYKFPLFCHAILSLHMHKCIDHKSVLRCVSVNSFLFRLFFKNEKLFPFLKSHFSICTFFSFSNFISFLLFCYLLYFCNSKLENPFWLRQTALNFLTVLNILVSKFWNQTILKSELKWEKFEKRASAQTIGLFLSGSTLFLSTTSYHQDDIVI